MDDFALFVKGKEEAWRCYHAINAFLADELLLDMSPKSRIQKATAPVEFVGYLITPHGIRIRKKTTAHIKRSLRKVSDLYANGEIDFDRALESLTCYIGMTKHCKGYNLRRWIADNITLQRKEGIT